MGGVSVQKLLTGNKLAGHINFEIGREIGGNIVCVVCAYGQARARHRLHKVPYK